MESSSAYFHLIGNPPSSGSTLLCNLLDSTRLVVCGPELELFCNKSLYSNPPSLFKFGKESFFTLQSTGIYFQEKHLSQYGLTENSFRAILKNATNLNDFSEKIRLQFLHFRGRDSQNIWIEKTPQNLNCIGEFLEQFPKSHFITIFRNPLYVYNSLIKRNRGGNFGALTTWLFYAAKLYPYIDHPRVILLKYEDLINAPEHELENLLYTLLRKKVDLSQIENQLAQNEYRKSSSNSIASWQAVNQSKIINANEKKISEGILCQVKTLMEYKITKAYAEKFDLAEISFTDALKKLDYYDDVQSQIECDSEAKKIFKTSKDHRKLLIKYFRGILEQGQPIHYYNILSHPIIKM